MQMNVFNEYTYTLEMIIQAGQRDGDYPVPIRTNGIYDLALSQSIPAYIQRSILTILRIHALQTAVLHVPC